MSSNDIKLFEIEVDFDHLDFIHSALNEICNGLKIDLFEQRIGSTRENATILLKKIGSYADRRNELDSIIQFSDPRCFDLHKSGCVKEKTQSITAQLTLNDFIIIKAALTVVLMDIEDFEFHARLGADRQEIVNLVKLIDICFNLRLNV